MKFLTTILLIVAVLSFPMKSAFAESSKSSVLTGSFKIELSSENDTFAPQALKADLLKSLRVTVGRRSSATTKRGSFRVSRIQPGIRAVNVLVPDGYKIISQKNLRRIRFVSGKAVSLELALRCTDGFVARAGECQSKKLSDGQPTFTGKGYAFYNTIGGRSNVLTLFSSSPMSPMLLELFNENGDLLLQNELIIPTVGSSIEIRTLVGNNSRGLLRISSSEVSQGFLEISALSTSKEANVSKSRQFLSSGSPSETVFNFAARPGDGLCGAVPTAKAFLTALGEALRENISIRIYSKEGRLERIEEMTINNHQLFEYTMPIADGLVEVATTSGAKVVIDFLSPESGCEQIL